MSLCFSLCAPICSGSSNVSKFEKVATQGALLPLIPLNSKAITEANQFVETAAKEEEEATLASDKQHGSRQVGSAVKELVSCNQCAMIVPQTVVIHHVWLV